MLKHSMRNRQTESAQHNAPTPFAVQPKRRLALKTRGRLVVILVLLLIGVGVWLTWPTLSGFFSKTEPTKVGPEALPEVTEETKRYIAVQEAAADLSQTQGKEAARAYVDEKIAGAATNSEKAMLLVYKSTISNDVPGAPLRFAQEAEALDESYTTASALASYYELAGDNANALKYYKLMLERADPGFAEQFPDDYATIGKKITYLESL